MIGTLIGFIINIAILVGIEIVCIKAEREERTGSDEDID